jgi:hypothetical protein
MINFTDEILKKKFGTKSTEHLRQLCELAANADISLPEGHLTPR